ncbi:MAG: DUF721 domain-containing protein [Actinomycetota bacterium]
MKAKYLGQGNRREPQEISDVLGTVIEKAAGQIDVRQGDLIRRWTEIVPGDWAEVASPIGVKDQTLLVEVPNGTAASLLKYQVTNLVKSISDEFGDDLVTAVKLRVSA